jgi:hypothetical protein
MGNEPMLTIEIKVNGRVVAEAELTNRSSLAPVSDYALRWVEYGDEGMGIATDKGRSVIEHHRSAQSPWALVTRACLAILRQKIDGLEAKP